VTLVGVEEGAHVFPLPQVKRCLGPQKERLSYPSGPFSRFSLLGLGLGPGGKEGILEACGFHQ
jgi:hypothetical protein